MKKFLTITFVLIALYLLFRNAEPYRRAIGTATGIFGNMWSGLTGG